MPKFTITASFTIINEKQTQVEFKALFDDQKIVDAVADFAILGNVEHQLKFDFELSKLTGLVAAHEFVIQRELNANAETLWKMFTTPDLMAKWYGPKEVRTGHCDLNFKRGGHYHFSMIAADQSESWGKVYYVDIVKNTRLIYINTFSNAKGEITRHPMVPIMPAELLTIINFIPVSDGKTNIEIKWNPINASIEEVNFFNQTHESFKMGWSGSLDRLEELLSYCF